VLHFHLLFWFVGGRGEGLEVHFVDGLGVVAMMGGGLIVFVSYIERILLVFFEDIECLSVFAR